MSGSTDHSASSTPVAVEAITFDFWNTIARAPAGLMSEARRRAIAEACAECGVELEGRQRVTCGTSKCREARFKRLHPESYARREAAKVERRRKRRRETR